MAIFLGEWLDFPYLNFLVNGWYEPWIMIQQIVKL